MSTDLVKEAFYKFTGSPLAPQFPSAHEEQEALWFFRAGYASASLVWTHDQPTQEGWYWISYDINFELVSLKHMYWYAGNNTFYFDDEGSLFPSDVYWWSGPIRTPEGPAVRADS